MSSCIFIFDKMELGVLTCAPKERHTGCALGKKTQLESNTKFSYSGGGRVLMCDSVGQPHIRMCMCAHVCVCD